MTNRSSTDWSRTELKHIAHEVLEGRTDLVSGAREMTPHIMKLGLADDPDGRFIRGVDSETDHYPVGEARRLWEQKALEELDRKLEDYLSRVSVKAKGACQRLIDKVALAEPPGD
jgi:hypothetical protein